MAKKKVSGDDSTIDIGQRLVDEFTKEYGDGVISSARTLADRPLKIISVCPTIDYAFGGGVTQGSYFVVTGKPKLGKTSILLKFAVNCQKAGMKVYYVNVEGRVKVRDFEGVEGLDVDAISMIGSTEDKKLSAEDFLMMVDKIASAERNCFFIIDSFSMLTEQSKLLEFGKKTRGEQGQIITAFCNSMASTVPLRGHIVGGITHIIANTGGQGMSPYSEKTANSLVYQSDFKLKVTYAPAWKDGDDQIGQIPHWKCEFSGLRGPGREVESYLRYGIGYDDTREYMNFAEEFGLISKGGAWYSLFPDDKMDPPIKLQGAERLWEYLRNPDNAEHYSRLVKETRELLGLPALA